MISVCVLCVQVGGFVRCEGRTRKRWREADGADMMDARVCPCASAHMAWAHPPAAACELEGQRGRVCGDGDAGSGCDEKVFVLQLQVLP